MTQRKQGIKFCSQDLSKEVVKELELNKDLGNKQCFKPGDKTLEALEKMIQGYQEMAEINLNISKCCFGVESEADGICIRLTECE